MGKIPKLWQKDYTLDRVIEKFTVGQDHLLDLDLVNSDCVASVGHAQMLESIGLLTGVEYENLKSELITIINLNDKGAFKIDISQEDCHTSIENHLTDVLGEPGKKIHTGRSRNDQVIAALRLFTRDFLLDFQGSVFDLAVTLVECAQKHADAPMPGRTHMQIAMPSSVGLWASAYAEQLLDDSLLLETAYELNNMSPLGSAASYGVPLPLDREMVADALGFNKVQNNVLYVNNSRGKTESIVLDAVEQVLITVSKLAQDIIIFSMPEFGYFTLPDEVCTGSSIMPQKKNPALLELVRARASTVSGLSSLVKNIIRALPSGYNRDFQETKAYFMDGIETGMDCVHIMNLAVAKMIVHREKLIAGFTPEIYATDYVLELVSEGMAFRDAYRKVAQNLDSLEKRDPSEAVKKKIHTGATGNLGLENILMRVGERRQSVTSEQKRVNATIEALMGITVEFFRSQRV